MDPAEASKFVQVLRSTFTALEVNLHVAHNLEIFMSLLLHVSRTMYIKQSDRYSNYQGFRTTFQHHFSIVSI